MLTFIGVLLIETCYKQRRAPARDFTVIEKKYVEAKPVLPSVDNMLEACLSLLTKWEQSPYKVTFKYD